MSNITWEKLIDQLTENARVEEEVKVILWITKKRDGEWDVITHPTYPSYKIEPKKESKDESI